MRTSIFTLFLCFAALSAFSQETPKSTVKEKIYSLVQAMPEYPGGKEGIDKYIKDNLKYPEAAKKEKFGGKVYIRFIIDSKGKVRDAHLAMGVRKDLDLEALRIVESMPDWKPANYEGQNVAVKYTLPIHFRPE